MNRTLYPFFALLSLVIGFFPIAYAVGVGLGGVVMLLSCVGAAGWIAAALMISGHWRVSQLVDHCNSVLGLEGSDRRRSLFGEDTARVLETSIRYFRASTAFSSESVLGKADLSANLRRIAEIAYEQLDLRCVELSLYDEESELWSQGVLIGSPKSLASQSMLVTASPTETGSAIVECVADEVIAMPIRFAGTTFGAIRAEMGDGKSPGAADVEVLRRLSTQGALMLVDARFTDEVLRMRRTSEESVRAKTGFLANLSHEIRGPLGTILAGVELMLEGICGELSDESRDTLGMVKTSGEHLLDLVNDVLDYAKVESGKIVVNPANILLKPLLEDLAMVSRSQAKTKKLALELCEVPETLAVSCDKRHLRQMLINLLTNAIKYTPEGGRIDLSVESLGDERLKICVADTGIGIREGDKDKVFGAFERVEDDYALRQGGTGLGMPLTRRLAQINGGDVLFESEYEKGSKFWIVLPRATIGEGSPILEALAGRSEVGEKGMGRGERLLLVEHDESARSFMERFLRNEGYEVLVARSGGDVLSFIKTADVDMALIDNDLPNLPGEEIVAIIRRFPFASNLPIVLLSARAFVFDIEKFLKLGVDRCLSKPVVFRELRETVRQLLDEGTGASS